MNRTIVFVVKVNFNAKQELVQKTLNAWSQHSMSKATELYILQHDTVRNQHGAEQNQV